MSQTRIYEVDGKRISSADLKEITERRCDGCGEYMAPNEGVSGSVQVDTYGGQHIGIRFDAHAGHEDEALVNVMSKAAEQVQWPLAF